MNAQQRIVKLSRRYPLLLAGAYTVWRAFQARFSVGAVGVVVNATGQFLLVEHAFHAKYHWGLPGGWVGRDEDPAAAVQREIQEELALLVDVGPVLLVETPFPRHLDLSYLCTALGEVGDLSYELLDFRWHEFQEFPKLSPFHQKSIRRAMEVLQVTL